MAKKFYGAIDLQNAQPLRLSDSDSSNYIALKAPATVASNVTLTMPGTDSTGTQALVSNGSGTLSWSDFLNKTLSSGQIYVGNGSNVATAVTPSGDVVIDNTGVTAISSGVIVNADINASAAIAYSKLAALTANRALASDGSGFVSATAVTATELGYVSGVTSAIQTQINNLSSTIQNFEWQPSVADRVTAPAGGESAGHRYLVIATATGAFAGQENKIAQYNGASWDFIAPAVGMFVAVDDEADRLYLYGGSSWDAKYFEATTASTGLTKVGFDIRLDSSAAGAGLGFSAGVLAVNVDNSTIEITTDTLNIKDGAITNAKVAAGAAIAVNKLAALTASRAVVSDASGFLTASAATSTEVGYLSGVTSAIQTQIDGKASRALDNLQVSGLTSQDLLVASSGTAVTRLAVGTEGQVLKVVSGNVAWASAGATSFAANWITADGASKTVTHSLGTKDVIVQVYDKTDDSTIEVDSVVRTDTNTVDLVASSAPGASGWRVLILKV